MADNHSISPPHQLMARKRNTWGGKLYTKCGKKEDYRTKWINLSKALLLLFIRIWAYECWIHIPYLEWRGDTSLSSIVEQKQPSSTIDCPRRINPGSDARPTTLSKTFNYRMIHLIHIHRVRLMIPLIIHMINIHNINLRSNN